VRWTGGEIVIGGIAFAGSRGIAKVEIATAKGRRQHEKRQAIATRDAQREAERELGRRR